MCIKQCRNVRRFGKLESNPEKAGVACCGFIAFVITTILGLLFLFKWLKARELGESYYCTDFRVLSLNQKDPYFVPENVGDHWKFAFLANLILYGILSVLNLLAIIGGWAPILRIWACVGYVVVAGYYIYVGTITTIVRFDKAGVYCSYAPYPGEIFTEHGAFLRKMVIIQWSLLCPLTCLATSGMTLVKREDSDPRSFKNTLPTED